MVSEMCLRVFLVLLPWFSWFLLLARVLLFFGSRRWAFLQNCCKFFCLYILFDNLFVDYWTGTDFGSAMSLAFDSVQSLFVFALFRLWSIPIDLTNLRYCYFCLIRGFVCLFTANFSSFMSYAYMFYPRHLKELSLCGLRWRHCMLFFHGFLWVIYLNLHWFVFSSYMLGYDFLFGKYLCNCTCTVVRVPPDVSGVITYSIYTLFTHVNTLLKS